MPTPNRTAPRAALLLVLLLALAVAGGVAGAAPATQGEPTATAAPTLTPTAAFTPTSAPSATAPASPTSAPSATAPASPTSAPSATEAVAPAQTVRLAIDKTLVGSDVVKVGQYLTFTIRITNTGSAVVTDLPLVDEFAPALLQPALDRTAPPPTSSTPGQLRWADLTATFGDLAPGQSVVVTTVFRAIRIEDEVINRARVETGLGAGGGGGAPVEGEAEGSVEGGSVTLSKALVPSFVDVSSPVISFTMTLRNEGFTDIVRAPLVDTYRTDLLQFVAASVPPDAHDPAAGELRWNNILAGLGVARLRPGETVTFGAAYRLLAPVDDLMVNSFDAVDVEDEFGNNVASPRRAEVRIRITDLGAEPTATAAPEPTPEEERRPRSTATATAPTAAPATATAAVEVTPTVESTVAVGSTPAGGEALPAPTAGVPQEAPTALPATGAARPTAAPWLLGLVALAAGLALRSAARRRHQ